MRPANNFIAFAAISLLLLACNNNDTKKEKTETVKDSSTNEHVETKTIPDSAFSLKLKFINFQFGDAAHFLFKDENGNDWDFSDNKDTHTNFAIELSKDKSNDENQGFAVNQELQGKWFNVKYIDRTQALYPDGPVGKVSIIIEAKPAQ